MTVTPDLDRRFREAAAAEDLLDVGFDVDRFADRPAARRQRPTAGSPASSYDPSPSSTSSGSRKTFGPRVLRSAPTVDAAHRQLDEYFEGTP